MDNSCARQIILDNVRLRREITREMSETIGQAPATGDHLNRWLDKLRASRTKVEAVEAFYVETNNEALDASESVLWATESFIARLETSQRFSPPKAGL